MKAKVEMELTFETMMDVQQFIDHIKDGKYGRKVDSWEILWIRDD